MQKYFINKIVNNVVSFQKQDELHITKVMRYKIDDKIIVIDNNSRKYVASLSSLNPLRAKIINEILDDVTNPCELNVFQASIKPNHMEIAISKACELNVTNFYIYNSNLSQNNIKHNLERYKRIIKESAEQSNRNTLMNIELVTKNEFINLVNQNDINIIAEIYQDNSEISLEQKNNFKKIGIVVGPEGGFNNDDINFLNQIKTRFQYLKLTKTILRSETALIYLLSVVSYFILRKKK